MKIINKDEARELSKYVGYLSLRGLDKVDDDVANELVNHVGTLRFLKPEISDAAIDSLKKHI
ncbi:hypothetical protein IKI14_00235 [bacterium]|nr:hypothetical protein [bacterium]